MKKIALFILIILLGLPFVFALEFDNVKDYEKTGKYGKITIKNAFGMGETLAEVELLENTDECLFDCSASGITKLYKNSKLFSKIEFRNIKNKLINLENIKFYIQKTEVLTEPVYETVCTIGKDANKTKTCNNILIGTQDREWVTWKEYNGEILVAGTYTWKIEGKKKQRGSIDWIASSQGVKLSNWAWWNDNWGERKKIIITENSGNTLNNYSLNLSIEYDSDMDVNFTDLRFVDSSGTSELNYFIESYVPSGRVNVTVKVNSIIASTTTNIYMYYKNPTASTTSNPNTTYLFYEDEFSDWLTTSGSFTKGGCLIPDAAHSRAYKNFTDITKLDGFKLTFEMISPRNGGGAEKIRYLLLGNDSITSCANAASDCFNWMGIQFKSDSEQSGGVPPIVIAYINKSDGEVSRDGVGAIADGGTAIGTDSVIYNYTLYRNSTGYYNLTRGDIWDTALIKDNNPLLDTIGNSFDKIEYFGRFGDSDEKLCFIKLQHWVQDVPTYSIQAEERKVLVDLIFPNDKTNIYESSSYFTAHINSSEFDTENSTLYVWKYDGTVFRTNATTLTGTSNVVNLSFGGIPVGNNYEWNYYSCGENVSGDKTCNSASSNYTFNISFTTSEIYSATTSETKPETFRINITYDSNFYSAITARLIHNGTSYLGNKIGTGNSIEFNKEITIPALPTSTSGSMNFYWEFSLVESGITYKFNSTSHSQTIAAVLFQICNNTFKSPTIVNFSIYDETNRSLISVSLDGTFEYGIINSTVLKNYSYISSLDNSSFKFCTNNNDTFIVDSIIHIERNLYNKRTFFFENKEYTNITTDEKMFLLNTSKGTNVIIQVKDAGLSALEGYFVDIERYYPGTNEYETVTKEKTDIYGQFVARLVENTIKYRFIFRNETNDIKKTTGDMTIACRASICILPFIIEDVTDDTEKFEDLGDYDWSLTFDDAINDFSFSWNDVSGVSATMRLEVIRYLWNGTTYVCNLTSTEISSSLNCSVGSTAASYQAQAFRKIIGESERRIAQLSAKVGSGHETFGVEGLIWSFFLLMIMLTIGYWYPPAGVALYLLGIVSLMLMNIIYISPAILIAQLTIGVAFIWAFHRRRSE